MTTLARTGKKNMATLADAMTVLYPTAVNTVDYDVITVSGTDSLRVYNRTLIPTDPTPAQVAAVTAQQVADAAAAKSPDRAALLAAAQAALDGNTAYLAIANPTTAQAVSQVKAMTQQMQKVIKYLMYVAGKIP